MEVRGAGSRSSPTVLSGAILIRADTGSLGFPGARQRRRLQAQMGIPPTPTVCEPGLRHKERSSSQRIAPTFPWRRACCVAIAPPSANPCPLFRRPGNPRRCGPLEMGNFSPSLAEGNSEFREIPGIPPFGAICPPVSAGRAPFCGMHRAIRHSSLRRIAASIPLQTLACTGRQRKEACRRQWSNISSAHRRVCWRR